MCFKKISYEITQFQVQLLGNLKKHYVGSINSQERAARIYDRHAILTHGLKAKTNYNYTKSQVKTILELEDDILYHDFQNNEDYTVDFIKNQGEVESQENHLTKNGFSHNISTDFCNSHQKSDNYNDLIAS